MHKIRSWVLGAAAVLLAAPGLAQDTPRRWWDARWNRRWAVTFTGGGVPVRDLPVVIRGEKLRKLVGDEPMSVASLRVIGPKGEIPCQFDEFDGTGRISRAPNHTLDNDDELAFQVDLPGTGKTTYWVYWSTGPLPLGRYTSRTLMGEAMEPGVWQHDIQLWSDQCLVGMRGRARGQDPSRNQKENWGAGALVLLRVYRLPVINIGRAWSSIFPLGAFGSNPSPEAERWECPRAMVRGPVRVAANCFQRQAKMKPTVRRGRDKAKGPPPIKVDVEHRVWLYERGAYVCFEEIITPHAPTPAMTLKYQCGFSFGKASGEEIWYSEVNKPARFVPTEAQISEAKKGKIVFQKGGLDPWMAGFSATLGKGHAVLADTGESGDDERQASCFSRTYTTFRYRRTTGPKQPGRPILQRFWVVGLRGQVDGKVPLATWRALTARPCQFGDVEKRGAQ